MLDGTLAVSTTKSKLEDGSYFTYCNLSSGSADAISVSEDIPGADKAVHSRLQLGIADAPLTTAKKNQPYVSCETLYNDKSGNAADVHMSRLEMSSTPGQALVQMSAFDGNQAMGKGLKASLGVNEGGGTSFVGISGDKISVTTSSGISLYPMANLKNALDNGAYVNRGWSHVYSSGDQFIDVRVVAGIVFLHANLARPVSGRAYGELDISLRPRRSLYLPTFYYGADDVMGLWVPGVSGDDNHIYAYDVAGKAAWFQGVWSWPYEG